VLESAFWNQSIIKIQLSSSRRGKLADVGNNIIMNGTISDRNFFEGDTSVAIEWHMRDLSASGKTAPLTLTYCFAR